MYVILRISTTRLFVVPLKITKRERLAQEFSGLEVAQTLETLAQIAAAGKLPQTLDVQAWWSMATVAVDRLKVVEDYSLELLGNVSPAVFIPVAEMIGFVANITDFVLDTVCTDMKRLDAQGIHLPRVSVNMSATELDAGAAERTSECLRRHGISPARITLEITENAPVVGKSGIFSAFDRLRQAGLRISIGAPILSAAWSLLTLQTVPLLIEALCLARWPDATTCMVISRQRNGIRYTQIQDSRLHHSRNQAGLHLEPSEQGAQDLDQGLRQMAPHGSARETRVVTLGEIGIESSDRLDNIVTYGRLDDARDFRGQSLFDALRKFADKVFAVRHVECGAT